MGTLHAQGPKGPKKKPLSEPYKAEMAFKRPLKRPEEEEAESQLSCFVERCGSQIVPRRGQDGPRGRQDGPKRA